VALYRIDALDTHTDAQTDVSFQMEFDTNYDVTQHVADKHVLLPWRFRF